MTTLFLLLYLASGIFFGLAAGRVVARFDFLSLGLLTWVTVEIIRTVQHL